MGPRASMLYSHEDPWRVSAFIFVFAQLLLTVLVLIHTILVCITFQLMKWYGWWIPSCRNSVYGHGDSCATKKPFNLDSNASRSSPLMNTERFLKHSRSDDWRSAESKPLVCPKCHGVWTFKQQPPFKNYRGTSSQWGDTPTCSDAGSHVEAGFRSKYACNIKTSEAADQLVCMKLCPEASNSVEQSVNNLCGTKTCDDAEQAAYENSCCETRNFTEESVNSVNTPIDIRKSSQTPVNEDGMFTDGFVEEAGSSTKVPVGDGPDRASLKSVGLEMTCHKLESSEFPRQEMQDEVFDEELSAVVKRKVDSSVYGSENAINGSKDEELYVVMVKKGDSKSYDHESVIKGLRQAVQKERKKLCSLYAELEVERIASETAANEAMSMISRLQEEKAALHMQAAHYQRMVEEKANYDEQAMQLLKEILYRKERDNYLLEKEVKFMKTRFCKDVRKFGKKRQDVERRSFFAKTEGTLLLKNVEEVSNLAEGQDMRNRVQELEMKSSAGMIVGHVENTPCPSRITEEQPLKRLKGSNDYENGTSPTTFLMSDTAHFALLEGNEKARNYLDAFPDNCFYLKEPSKFQQYVAATTSSDSKRVFNFGLSKQVCEKMPNASENGESFTEVSMPLDLAQSASSAMDSGLESCHFVANSKENQKVLSQAGEAAELLPLHNDSKAHVFGDRLHKEAEVVCSNKGKSDFFTPCLEGVAAMMACCEANSSVTACATNGQETPDQAGAEVLQSMNFDLKDHAGKDLQTRLQIFESDMMPRSCPSSLNNKGSGVNKFEENDSSLMRSHVH